MNATSWYVTNLLTLFHDSRQDTNNIKISSQTAPHRVW